MVMTEPAEFRAMIGDDGRSFYLVSDNFEFDFTQVRKTLWFVPRSYKGKLILGFAKFLDMNHLPVPMLIPEDKLVFNPVNGFVSAGETYGRPSALLFNPHEDIPVCSIFPHPDKLAVELGVGMDKEFRDIINSFNSYGSNFTLIDRIVSDIAKLSNKDLFKFWKLGIPYKFSYLFYREPSMIRAVIGSILSQEFSDTCKVRCLNSLLIEVSNSARDHGLDPIWESYVNQHIRELLKNG